MKLLSLIAIVTLVMLALALVATTEVVAGDSLNGIWDPETDRISPDLRQRLEKATTGEFVSVILFMKEQFNLVSATEQQRWNSFSRQARHDLVTAALKDFSLRNQAELRATLESARANNVVASFTGYWIANAMRVRATRDFILSLADRNEIGAIVEDLPPQSLYIPNIPEDATSVAGTTSALRVVGADDMWQLGYTGAGRLVASFDSGVDGSHPALASSWRGLTHSSAESWFDPVYEETLPHWESSLSSGSHGTNTLGIIVGKNDATGDTTGVAFGAQWIHAMVVDVPGANILEAFQWAADPDGNPATVADVPDAINNSWGYTPASLGCADYFYAAIDNVEALGAVVVFAAGNEGPGSSTLRNPANRASTPFNSFSVGGTDTLGTSIWSGSSRGPSTCNGTSIKPEICAPGLQVRSTNAGSATYGLHTGTSFAAPFVTGAVALLREYNPNATVDEIKAALINSATDRGSVGDDNTFGHGLLNIPGALALMPPLSDINIIVADVLPDSAIEGSVVNAVVELRNLGLGTLGVTGQLSSADAGLSIVDGFASFGDLAGGASGDNSSNPFVLQIAPGIPDGTILQCELSIEAGAGSYTAQRKFAIRIGDRLFKASYTHDGDSCKFTISNYASYGLATGSALEKQGVGFTYPASGTNNLFQCGLLLGISSTAVADGITNQALTVERDFQVAPGGNLITVAPGVAGDVETISRFNDQGRFMPIGLEIQQRTIEFNGAVDGNFVIMQYVIQNTSDSTLANLHVGIYCDWDFAWGSGSRDVVNFSRPENLGYMRDNSNPIYRGTSVVSAQGATEFRAINNSAAVYDGITESEKFTFLTAGLVDTASTSVQDHSYMISVGPISLAPQQQDTVAFAMLGASSLTRLREAASRAGEMYTAASSYVPGDADGSGIVTISDAVFLINYIFGGGPAPNPLAAGDADCSGIVSISDAVYIINYIFGGGPAPCSP